jgi:hypothetical protein
MKVSSKFANARNIAVTITFITVGLISAVLILFFKEKNKIYTYTTAQNRASVP